MNRAFRDLFVGHPDLDEVIAYDRGKSGVSLKGIVQTARLCGRLREQRFDLTIDLQGLLRSALMAAATRAGVRVGLADAREGAGWFYHIASTPRGSGCTAVDRVLRVAAALGVEDPEPKFHLPPRTGIRHGRKRCWRTYPGRATDPQPGCAG